MLLCTKLLTIVTPIPLSDISRALSSPYAPAATTPAAKWPQFAQRTYRLLLATRRLLLTASCFLLPAYRLIRLLAQKRRDVEHLHAGLPHRFDGGVAIALGAHHRRHFQHTVVHLHRHIVGAGLVCHDGERLGLLAYGALAQPG